MTKIVAAIAIAGCASMFLAALPAEARLAQNGVQLNKPAERLASNGAQTQSSVKQAGLNLSRIGQKPLGK